MVRLSEHNRKVMFRCCVLYTLRIWYIHDIGELNCLLWVCLATSISNSPKTYLINSESNYILWFKFQRWILFTTHTMLCLQKSEYC